MKAMELEALEGKTIGFCGVDNHCFCVKTRSARRIAFEVLEDPDDGYRSSMEKVHQVLLMGNVFFRTPIARLRVERDENLGGWKLVDPKTKHAWLRFGTDYSDSYYPCFTFDYDPPRKA